MTILAVFESRDIESRASTQQTIILLYRNIPMYKQTAIRRYSVMA